MVNMSPAAYLWLNKKSDSLPFCHPCRFFDKVRECCNYPAYIKDELSEWLKVVRLETNRPRLPAFAERLKMFDDPRATYELYLMGFWWGLVYPSDSEHITMARHVFKEHVSRPLSSLQKELLADMVRNSAEDGDFVFQALLPVVDKSFEHLLLPRIEEAKQDLENYLARPDWEGDYYDQINVIMYEERAKELETLLKTARTRK